MEINSTFSNCALRIGYGRLGSGLVVVPNAQHDRSSLVSGLQRITL